MMSIDKTTELITVEQLSFAYDGEEHPVWQGLNCSFKEHTINLILGPSGCGKSTLLHILNGIVPHFYEGKADGHIWFKGKDILQQKTKDLVPHIGIVFQNPDSQFCTCLVEDELAFGLENQATEEAEIEKMITDVLKLVGMEGMQKALLSELSGGQKQKIAIASVLITNVEVLVMDEPTANLDAVSRHEIFQLLQMLSEQNKKTIILVEHNLEHLLDKIGHVIVFDNHKNICLEGKTGLVLRKLLYDTAYEELNIFLPERYMVVRQWLRLVKGSPAAEEFRNRECIKNDSKAEILSPQDFVNLWKALTEKMNVNSYADTVNDKYKNPLILVQNLQFIYSNCEDEKGTLQHVDFSIHPGEFVALVGANGAGKSTFLKVLFRALPDYKGVIEVKQKDLKKWNKKELYQDMGLVFQNPEDQFLTNIVYDELLFSLKQSDLQVEEKVKKLEVILERFHLSEEKEKSPFLLSQGQKRRLSVATMLLTGQKILFLDEPTYGQDYENQRELMDLMLELNEAGVTIVVVTHDMSLVADYAMKVIVLSDGETRFCGRPEEIFDNVDAVERGKLEIPQAYYFSKKLHELEPSIPICFSGKKLLEYLSQNIKGGR